MRCKAVLCLCSIVLSLIGVIFLGIGLIFYAEFDSIFGTTVRQQMMINDQVMWWYEIWLRPPVKETLTVHMFEVDNAEELKRSWIQTGSIGSNGKPVGRIKPQMREIGPFVFRVERTKERVNFTSDEKQQIHYDERTLYHFDSLMSFESLDHRVTVVNVELMSLNPFITNLVRRASHVSRISRSLNKVINEIMQLYVLNLFVERPVWRIIFGTRYRIADDSMEEEANSGNSEVDDGDRDSDNDMESEENDSDSINMQMQSETNQSTIYSVDQIAKITDDATVLAILKLYDQIKTYLDRLDVDVNPYDLLIMSKHRNTFNVKSKLQKYKVNSVMAFFQNNSIDKYDIYTGLDTNQNSEIIRWNSYNILENWSGKSCNLINGTDGHQYPPFMREDRIYTFIPRICRSVALTLSETSHTSSHGVSYWRFSTSRDFMQNPVRNGNNRCFCRYSSNSKRCNFEGILDLYSCYGGAPIILTSPHLSGRVTKSIVKEISGLTPDDSIYQTYLDLEPVSGIVLDKVTRFQFNVHISSMPIQLGSNQSLPEMIVPLFWYQEQWTASSEYQSHIKYFFIYPLKYQEMTVMVMIMFGLALLVVSMFLGCCCCGKNSTSKLAKKSSGKVSSVDDRNMYHDNNRPMSEPILEPIQYYANDVKINGPDVDYDKGDGYYDNQNYIDNELLPPLTNNQQQQFPLKRLKNPPPMMRNSFGPPNRINSFQNEPEPDYNYFMDNNGYGESMAYGGVGQQQQDPYGLMANSNTIIPGQYGSNGANQGHYQMVTPPRSMPPPPPPAPLISTPSERSTPQPQNYGMSNGGGGGGSRQNLLNEIRQGTTLRKTPPNESEYGESEGRLVNISHLDRFGVSVRSNAHHNNPMSNLVINIATANEQYQQHMLSNQMGHHHSMYSQLRDYLFHRPMEIAMPQPTMTIVPIMQPPTFVDTKQIMMERAQQNLMQSMMEQVMQQNIAKQEDFILKNVLFNANYRQNGVQQLEMKTNGRLNMAELSDELRMIKSSINSRTSSENQNNSPSLEYHQDDKSLMDNKSETNRGESLLDTLVRQLNELNEEQSSDMPNNTADTISAKRQSTQPEGIRFFGPNRTYNGHTSDRTRSPTQIIETDWGSSFDDDDDDDIEDNGGHGDDNEVYASISNKNAFHKTPHQVL